MSHCLHDSIEISLDYYDNIQIGKIWNQYRCARIVLSENILLILNQLVLLETKRGQEWLSETSRCIKVIKTMLSGIYDSIPFHLQEISPRGEMIKSMSMQVLGGEHLLWPLGVLLHNFWSGEHERTRAWRTLDTINTKLGLRQASKIVQAVAAWTS